MQQAIAGGATDQDGAQVCQAVPTIKITHFGDKRPLPNHLKQFSECDIKNISQFNAKAKPYVLRNKNGKIVGFVSAGMEEDGVVHIGPLAVATNQQVQ